MDLNVRGAEKKPQLLPVKNQVYSSLLEGSDKPFMLEDLSNSITISIELSIQ